MKFSKVLFLGFVAVSMGSVFAGCGRKDPEATAGAVPNNGAQNCSIWGCQTPGFPNNPNQPFPTQSNSSVCPMLGSTYGQPFASSNQTLCRYSYTRQISLSSGGGIVAVESGAGVPVSITQGDTVIIAAGGKFGHYRQGSTLGGLIRYTNTLGCDDIAASNTSSGLHYSIDGSPWRAVGMTTSVTSASNATIRLALNSSTTNSCSSGAFASVSVTRCTNLSGQTVGCY